MSILVLNTGSSSLKFARFDADPDEPELEGQVDWHGAARPSELTVRPRGQAERRGPCDASDPADAATLAIRSATEGIPVGGSIAAVGHRIVHGGPRFVASVRVDSALESELGHLAGLAPLHNPPALKAIEAARRALPGVAEVAVFDTAFFAGLPRSASVYPVPWEWHEAYGIRKFGFHGISHAYCAEKAAALLGRAPDGLKLVVCHLGNGCSASAILGGRPLDTTMGFTPLDGLMMGTRPGEVDPGIVLELIKSRGMTVDQVEDALNHRSGLLGVSGVSSDYREVEAAADGGNDRARLALEIYAARVRKAIGGLAATLGGLDALVFAGGVGEHGATLRAAACAGLDFLGVRVDPSRNAGNPRDADIAPPGAPVRVLVVRTREDLMIAREVRRLAPGA